MVLPTSMKSKLLLPEKVNEPEVIPTQPIESQKPADSGDSSHSFNLKSIVQSPVELILEKEDEEKALLTAQVSSLEEISFQPSTATPVATPVEVETPFAFSVVMTFLSFCMTYLEDWPADFLDGCAVGVANEVSTYVGISG
ncbi:hypothetical protein PanWU01x14_253160 [Parasponia andersonii]|uniref:Uncharacterized protein n=1 Tax=Parasponia andersonii TaxID=3476 RepID=A0A2P5BBM7_PARAD|nr:hypothetical protein PanWU01x14_253160 [Parasponia andersonii]